MSPAQNDVTGALVGHALEARYEALTPDVVAQTKALLLDYLGVAFGGVAVAESSGPITAGVLELAEGGAGQATVIGRSERLPAHYAALLNATYAHSMDFDDTHRESVIHIGTPMFATLLALGERAKSGGRDLLAAAAAGYDVTAAIGMAHGGAVHAHGFHPTATTGVFGCTAAGARLLGLSAEQTANALGLNVSQSAGSLQFLVNGAWNKRFHVGLSAHHAIVALTMARHGYVGSTEPIEGRDGYLRLYAGDAGLAPRVLRHLSALGERPAVLDTAVKPYPSCRYTHPSIDALTELVRSGHVRTEDVDSVSIEFGPTAYGLVGIDPERKRAPVGVVDGQFSVYFTAAATLLTGGFGWDRYDLLTDPAARAMAERVSVTQVDSLGASMETRVRVGLRSGQTIERTVPYPKGEPENPLTWEELSGKFTEWASGVLGSERARRVADAVASLEDSTDLGKFAALLRP
ncbi:MAG: MmgE/PrpD family protein [Chloroflexota bacterium]